MLLAVPRLDDLFGTHNPQLTTHGQLLEPDTHADRPLAGMCDSARCPQATHHPCHRPVWAEHAAQTKFFLGSLGPTRQTERTRLQADYDRALCVIADIGAATTPKTDNEADT